MSTIRPVITAQSISRAILDCRKHTRKRPNQIPGWFTFNYSQYPAILVFPSHSLAWQHHNHSHAQTQTHTHTHRHTHTHTHTQDRPIRCTRQLRAGLDGGSAVVLVAQLLLSSRSCCSSHLAEATGQERPNVLRCSETTTGTNGNAFVMTLAEPMCLIRRHESAAPYQQLD